jgi:hypothetical protein
MTLHRSRQGRLSGSRVFNFERMFYREGKGLVSGVRKVITQITIHTGAIYLAMLAAAILTMLLILVFPPAGQTSTFVGRMLEPPFWIPEITCGAAAGWFVRKHFFVLNPGLGILIPLLLLLCNILTEGLRMRRYIPLIDIYFSANNGDTEGLYKLFLTAPLYTAIAYCLGALAFIIKIKMQYTKPAKEPAL